MSSADGTTPVVSVIIVTWNSAGVVPLCIQSIIDGPPTLPWEAVIVDNGSADDTVDVVRDLSPHVRVIANASNRGLAAANNQGMLAAAGDYFVISNPDVVYARGAIDALVDLLDRRPEAAFAFAGLHHPDGRVQTCTGDLPTLGEAFLGRAARLRRPDPRRQGFWWHGWDHATEVPIGHGGEACYATRRATVARLGLQDERFRLDWEGIDWTARAAELGWQAWFCPEASVVHMGGASIRRAPWRWIASTHRGMYRYFADRSSPAARPLLAVAVAGRALAKATGSLAGVAGYDAAHDRA